MPQRIVEKELSYEIAGGFFEVYNDLGYGFLESPYARAMEIALRKRGLLVEREYPIEICFQEQPVGFHRLDMFVERRVAVEIKSSELLPPVAKRQLRNYVTALNLELGILLHFGPKAEYHRVLGAKR